MAMAISEEEASMQINGILNTYRVALILENSFNGIFQRRD